MLSKEKLEDLYIDLIKEYGATYEDIKLIHDKHYQKERRRKLRLVLEDMGVNVKITHPDDVWDDLWK